VPSTSADLSEGLSRRGCLSIGVITPAGEAGVGALTNVLIPGTERCSQRWLPANQRQENRERSDLGRACCCEECGD
jgi:hypothetical protein